MFFSGYKKEVLKSYGESLDAYNRTLNKGQKEIQRLYERRRISIELILAIETLVNSIANSPKEYEVVTEKIRLERKKFSKTEEYAAEASLVAKKAGVNIAAGVAGGTAVAAAAPTVAMWIATTFGTASTGTAISALSGAAAKSAALAWLGGGTLAAGGAGMAGGQALLMLAGPLGWAIAGGAVVISTSVLSVKNRKIADNAAKEEKEIRKRTGEMSEMNGKVLQLSEETVLLYGKMKKLYEDLNQYRGRDFRDFDDEIRVQFGGLVNDTFSLSEMLNKKV